MSFENPKKQEKHPLGNEELDTDVSGLIDNLEKKDPSIRGMNAPRETGETAPQIALTDRILEIIHERMEKEGISPDEAIKELESEGAFKAEMGSMDKPLELEKLREELEKELEEDGVAA